MSSMVITGASGGLGRVVVTHMRSVGWTVYPLDRADGDLASESDVQRMFTKIPPDVSALVHLAGGIVAGKPLEEISLEELHTMFATNLVSTFNVMRNVLPLFKAHSGGSIVTIGAQAFHHPVPSRAAYAAAKSGVVSLTQSVAEEGRLHNIRANCILPSIIRTAANLEWAQGDEAEAWVTPEQIAETIAHLCSPACAINGAVIPIYGKGAF
ncbi:MAG: SDR family NAD(P)-dependent oxidoreductase [Candidatus Kapabacteria bacterium]|nr:SDR family NAD(P)-dependent oxidoreductase [Candidatus Kapabacteria bacterium]